MEDNPIAVEIRDISKSYPHTQNLKAIDNISLSIPVGEVCCFLGPNGAGKTTLLKIIAGLLKPNTGSLSIMGLDPTKKPMLTRAHIGWMPAEERSGFYGRLNGNQNLKFFASLHGIPIENFDRHIGNLALQLGIKDQIDHMFLQTSGGFKQKLGLLRALIHNPSVLLLDEPFRNLDPHSVQRFRRLVKHHLTRIQKKTVILSTHQLEEAYRVADTIAFMNHGQIVKIMNHRELTKSIQKSSMEELYLKIIKEEESE